jgi:hypothetical protein
MEYGWRKRWVGVCRRHRPYYIRNGYTCQAPQRKELLKAPAESTLKSMNLIEEVMRHA